MIFIFTFLFAGFIGKMISFTRASRSLQLFQNLGLLQSVLFLFFAFFFLLLFVPANICSNSLLCTLLKRMTKDAELSLCELVC